MGAVFGIVGAVTISLIIASIPVICLIRWGLDGSVDGSAVFFGVLLYLGLLVAVVAAPSSIGIGLLMILIASAIAMPLLGSASSTVQLKRMQDETLQRYSSALEKDPMDPVARIAVAETLYKRGEMAQAIEHLEWTLQNFPRLSTRLAPQLESWKRAREREREGVLDPIWCHMCRAENSAYATSCIECGAPFGSREGILKRIAEEGGPTVIIRGWLIVGSFVMVSLFLLLYLPMVISGPIILATVIVMAWLFLRWVGGDVGRPGDI